MDEIKHPLTLKEAARALRLRYAVVRRLVRSGKLRGEKRRAAGVGQGPRFRFVIAGEDLARVRRERPWASWAMRRFKNTHGEA